MTDRVDELLAAATYAERRAAEMKIAGDRHAEHAYRIEAQSYLEEAEEVERSLTTGNRQK